MSSGWMSDAVKEAVRDIIAGTFGGIAGRLVEYPFDTVKTKLQAASLGAFTQYKNAMDCFMHIVRLEGLRGLYRGLSAPLAGTVVETSTLFFINGRLKRMLSDQGKLKPGEELPMPLVFVAGAGTGFFVSFVLTPIELIKCRLQVSGVEPGTAIVAGQSQHNVYRGPLDCLRKSVRNEGLSVLYRGHFGTMLREVPGTAAWFYAYEAFCRAMTPVGIAREDLPASTIITAGALGGVSYWVIMYPADTIKSLQQIQDVAPPAAAAAPMSAAPAHCLGAAAAGSRGAGGPASSSSGASPVPSSGAAPLATGGATASAKPAARYDIAPNMHQHAVGNRSGALTAALGSSGPQRATAGSRAAVPLLPGIANGLGSSAAAAAALGRSAFSTAAAASAAAAQAASGAVSFVAARAAAAHAPPPRQQPLGFVGTARAVYRTAGLRGIYAGFWPTLLRAAPSNAAIFMGYEACNSKLKQYM